ncbi:MAG: phosphate acyltransferase PlsX [Chloroflexi bacterium]|nr:phosphate acyltransferase PlsX [Chloroflexota bacterium]
MRIVVDAMGSDACPAPDVAGAVLAARELGSAILLVGDEKAIKAELVKHHTVGLKIDVVHAAETIAMTDKPSAVIKGKPQSSMHVGMNLVKDGQADGFISAGNTGAALAIAMLATLKRIPNVERPALSSIVRIGGRSVILLDVGANADCKPEWLTQFAVMGSIYARTALGLAKPRIGLLSNGEEEGKGTALIHKTAELLQETSLTFVGNIEPREIFEDHADVIVSDGFVGNILIKSLEGATSLLLNLIRREIRSGPLSTLGGLLARPAFNRVRKEIDPFEIGGAPLLGVNGVVIIGHGRSNDVAIKNCVRQAEKAAAGGLIDAIREGITQPKV